MRHLKPEDVDYVSRPLTLYERHLQVALEAFGSDDRHPQYYTVWASFLWSRQDEKLPNALFHDILLPDFEAHQYACLAGIKEASDIQRLSDNWKFDFHEKPVRSKEDVIRDMKEWERRHGKEAF